jgi:hypothetical protein
MNDEKFEVPDFLDSNSSISELVFFYERANSFSEARAAGEIMEIIKQKISKESLMEAFCDCYAVLKNTSLAEIADTAFRGKLHESSFDDSIDVYRMVCGQLHVQAVNKVYDHGIAKAISELEEDVDIKIERAFDIMCKVHGISSSVEEKACNVVIRLAKEKMPSANSEEAIGIALMLPFWHPLREVAIRQYYVSKL